MPLSWNEIKTRAGIFAKEWATETREAGEYQTFWNDFFEVFGIRRKSVAIYQKNVTKLSGQPGFIDLFWTGKLICEHKSAGQDLDKAFDQAADYFTLLKEELRPRYIIVTDYRRIRLCDLEPEAGQLDCLEFDLADFPKKVRHFGFIAGYREQEVRDEDPINVKAAETVGELHDALAESGYSGHQLEMLLVRLVYCFFADDTRIFEPDAFHSYITNRTSEDGSDFGAQLSMIFQTLDTPIDKRQSSLDEDLAVLPYVDGNLFSEPLSLPAFDSAMRAAVIRCASFDWSGVSPAVFGSMFQSVMDPKQRHDLGAHYTSEKNILKVIRSLFLDNLRGEFDRAAGLKTPDKRLAALRTLHDKVAKLKFLDPACGCGNFLVVTYRELRLLEIDILKTLFPIDTLKVDDVGKLSLLDVDQLYGIEIEEFPSRVAELALWLTDHQMNQRLGNEFGQYCARLPLRKAPHIVQGNALTLDWETVVPKEGLSYIFGNPPFIGARVMDDGQKAELIAVFNKMTGAGNLDYVTGWYAKAAQFIQGTGINVAFVSTNSITQGEQVGILWNWLFKRGIRINFAHRTFRWSNEARGKAAVYCVIIGFGLTDALKKWLFDYETPNAEPLAVKVEHINPYLVDAEDILIVSRQHPLCGVPEIGIGNKPIDDGNYLFTPEEKAAFLALEPQAEKYFRRWLGADEFLNGIERWCLWLGDCPPEELRQMPEALKRVEAVKKFRLASKSESTRKIASKPRRFHVENIPHGDYLLIPSVSSERRRYIPIGFIKSDILASNLVLIVPEATIYHFGILTSEMHMAWVRQVCGRLKSDYRYSKDIVYNNYPWPVAPTKEERLAVETAAQAVLDTRAKFSSATLADLYDPRTMPADLLSAHHVLDRAVDRCYGTNSFKTEVERLVFLFKLYQEYST